MLYPIIGQWFRRPSGTLFEVVAIDDDDRTVEIQQLDGTIDEVDIDVWHELLLTEVSAPEDWSGSVDMDPEDFVGKNNGEIPPGYQDPLAFLDKL
jgi:hypothetical protein